MKKLLFLLPVILLTFAACSGEEPVKESTDSSKDTEKAADAPLEFKTFTDKEAGFSIDFPGDPEVFDEKVPLGDGLDDLIMKTYMYQVDLTNVYFVSYIDYPPSLIEGSDPQTLLQAGKEGGLGQLGESEIIEEKEIDLGGNPGLYLKAKSTDSYGNYFGIYNFYLVGNRLYQIIMMTDSEFHSDEEVASFAGSFKLL